VEAEALAEAVEQSEGGLGAPAEPVAGGEGEEREAQDGPAVGEGEAAAASALVVEEVEVKEAEGEEEDRPPISFSDALLASPYYAANMQGLQEDPILRAEAKIREVMQFTQRRGKK
jgi:hypothetical protein